MGKNKGPRTAKTPSTATGKLATKTSIKTYFEGQNSSEVPGDKMAPDSRGETLHPDPSSSSLSSESPDSRDGRRPHSSPPCLVPQASPERSPHPSPGQYTEVLPPPPPQSEPWPGETGDAEGAVWSSPDALSEAVDPPLDERRDPGRQSVQQASSSAGWTLPPGESPGPCRPQRSRDSSNRRSAAPSPGLLEQHTQVSSAPSSSLTPMRPGLAPLDTPDAESHSPSPPHKSHKRKPILQTSSQSSSDADMEDFTSWRECIKQIPTKSDFRLLIQEVRETCKSEIQTLRNDFLQLTYRVDGVDEELQSAKNAISRLQSHCISQATSIRDLQRHVEDLDNRGRRNNLRIKGLPEPSGPEDLNATLQSLFREILGTVPPTEIEMDRAHRALRPRGASANPRDIICRIHYFRDKAKILQKTRNMKSLEVNGAPIQIYPDLAWSTLQQRRSLQPLLTLLRDNNIPYRWGFPFSLIACKDGRSTTLRVPEDLSTFCSNLQLTCPSLSGWDPLPQMNLESNSWQKVTPRKKSVRLDASSSTPSSRTRTHSTNSKTRSYH